MWGRELGNTSHNMGRVALHHGGQGGRRAAHGRFLNFDGKEHAKLLVSVAQLMGMTTTTKVGNRQTSTGPLAGLVG